MEKKKKDVLPKNENPSNESEESTNLDLKELLEIEGGIEVNEDSADCGLGCFLTGIY